MGRTPRPFPAIEFRGLKWPENTPRTEIRRTSRYFVAFPMALQDCKKALRTMHVTSAYITWNIIETAPDVARQADNTANPDPGVAIWFNWKDKDRVVACDAWTCTKSNLRTITTLLSAMFKLEQAGCAQMLEQAMQSFSLAVPEKDKFEILESKAHLNPELDWCEILGLRTNHPTVEEVTRAHKILAFKYHPDRVDDDGSQKVISAAYQVAKRAALGLQQALEATEPLIEPESEPEPEHETTQEEPTAEEPKTSDPEPWLRMPDKKPKKAKMRIPDMKAARRPRR